MVTRSDHNGTVGRTYRCTDNLLIHYLVVAISKRMRARNAVTFPLHQSIMPSRDGQTHAWMHGQNTRRDSKLSENDRRTFNDPPRISSRPNAYSILLLHEIATSHNSKGHRVVHLRVRLCHLKNLLPDPSHIRTVEKHIYNRSDWEREGRIESFSPLQAMLQHENLIFFVVKTATQPHPRS